MAIKSLLPNIFPPFILYRLKFFFCLSDSVNLNNHYSVTKHLVMKQRMNFYEKGYNALKPLLSLGAYLSRSTIEEPLMELVSFRVSQINGCAYCLDMHSKDLRAKGETEQRLYMISAWREAPLFSNRERAALVWAEAVTKLENQDVPDEVYEEAMKEFSEQELVDLTMGVIAINAYNRLNVAFRTPSGNYVVGQHAVHVN
jgi:AhpD family alkylhydroperoxidase